MASLSAVFTEAERTNWLKAWLAVEIAKSGLEQFVDIEAKTLHTNIYNTIWSRSSAPAECKGCHTANLLKCPTQGVCKKRGAHGNCTAMHDTAAKQPRPCPKNVCNKVHDEIVNQHTFSNPSWKNTSAQQWAKHPWEIAKCYFPPDGYVGKTSVQDTDFNGLISFIMNCKHFNNMFSFAIAVGKQNPPCLLTKARKLRNEICHPPSLKISDQKLQEYFTTLIKLLSDSKCLAQDKEAKTAVLNLDELQNERMSLNDLIELLKKSHKTVKDVNKPGELIYKEMDETLAKALKILEARIQDLEERHENTETRVQVLEERHENTETQVQDLKERYENTETEVTDLKERNENTETEVKDLKERTENTETQVKDLKVRNENTETELKDLKERTENTETEVKDLKERNKNTETLVQDLEKRHENTETRVQAVEERHENTDTRVQDLEERTENIETKVNDLKEQNEYIETKVQDLKERSKSNIQAVNQIEQEEYERGVAELIERTKKLYRDTLNHVPISPLNDYKHEKLGDVYMPPKIVKMSEDKGVFKKTDEQVTQYKGVFLTDDKVNRRIFLQGEAGSGKTTFLSKLALDWCGEPHDISASDNSSLFFSDIDVLQSFVFVFHITLRNSVKQFDVYTLIKQQIIDSIYSQEDREKAYKLVNEIMKREQCLILLDGLDEWTGPGDHHNLPELVVDHSECVMLFSTRPWKLAVVKITHLNRYTSVQLEGVNKPFELSRLILGCLVAKDDLELKCSAFKHYIAKQKLDNLLSSPMMLSAIVCSFAEGIELKGSKCEIYILLLESLFKKANSEMRTFEQSSSPCFRDALPHNYFELIWGQDLWQHMVTETNRYAEQERTRNPPPPFAPRWVPVDIPAMKAFIGLCFCMGVLRLPSRNDYWRYGKVQGASGLSSVHAIEWGIKVWTLAESETGYIHQFQVYTGKEENQEKGLSHRVVTDLIGHLNHTNIRVFMDNYYTSPALLTDLHMRGVYACGTVRNNRKGLPTALLPRNVMLDKHEFLVAQKDELSCCIWQDTKCVMVLSNFHSPNDMGTVNRRSGNPTQQSVEVPKMLADYQKFMKGVDLSDQMIGYHIINHRSRKWWRRLFFHFMMGSALNAYIIAKDSNPETVGREWPNIQDFVEDLADGLIGDYCAGKDAPILDTARPARVHTMERLFEKEKCILHDIA
ncbi:uncharacterized protein LOC127845914 [Dreissena polymorpha]|uniref:uncharacterized protein LOC127845914 n=1 Tax=Dreissena polymorpha TaxID=45954 RepID=UPI002263AE87|nr:uncharacterized protein LOC127845914 [Dreissena polymorpha]